jgi:cell wall-associated NlpC family hydrolase
MLTAPTVRAINLSAVLAAALLAGCAAKPSLRPPPPDPRDLFAAAAIAMLDQPYRYGGATPGGFDCSGLAQYAAAQAGLMLPRTTREQQNTGASVKFQDMQKGDLIFFHLPPGDSLHVGIFLGDTRFIHAPSSGGHVRIDRADAKPYMAGFLGARRIFANPEEANP